MPTIAFRDEDAIIYIIIIEVVETLLATTHVASVENLDTGLGTVDPCFGQDATSPPATIAILDSPTTSRPEASQASSNQSSEDDLGAGRGNHREI